VKIWVTGALGFIGRQVTQHALAAGHEVRLVVREPVQHEPHSAAPPAQLRSGNNGNEATRLTSAHTTLEIDLRDTDRVTSLVLSERPDVVIHLAWYAKPQDYLISAENVDSLASTLAFARAVVNGGCRRMVGVGTCLEYADLPRPRLETDPLDPKSLYARCKHSARLVLAELFRQSGASLAWARLFHLHGPGEHPSRLIPSLAAAVRAGRPFALSPGEQVRDHLDVRDVGSALVHVAVHPELEGTVNVCSGKPVTLRTVLEVVGRELGRPELLEFGKRAYLAGEVMNLAGVPTRLFESGWQPAHGDLAASIRDAIAARS
jgi:nucleoside-diphosphate-sugar epimerase